MAAKCYRTILIAKSDYSSNEWELAKKNCNNFATE